MLLVKNGNVYLGQGRYEAGWDVLCDGPVIAGVGPGLSAAGADVIDASGRSVYPGVVLGLCAVGAMNFSDRPRDINEAAEPVCPEMNIRHAFDIRELKRQRFARDGITSYGLCPGTNALIAGQMALIHVAGERTAELFLADRMAVKANYTQAVKDTFKDKNGPATRMSMYQHMVEAFRAAAEYMGKKDRDYDEGKEVLCRVLKKEIPFVVAAETPLEIESVIDIGKKYDLRMVITGAYGICDFADEVMARGWHVMLGDSTYNMAGIKGHVDLKRLVGLYRKGLSLSLFCSGDVGYPPAYEQVWWTAALMSQAGATGDELMDMLTQNPARALGVEHLVGALETGRQADLIICRGNPAVRFDNYIDETIVAGRPVFAREGK